MNQITLHTPGSAQTATFTQHPHDGSLLRAALKAGVGFPYECHSGGCGSCRFELLEGEVEELWPEAPGLSPRDRARNRRLACQCVAKTQLSIRVSTSAAYQPRTPPRALAARLAERVALTHDIFELRFETQEPAMFLPGQYALLQLPMGLRAYSMANIANDAGHWHFQIRRTQAGQGSAYLTQHMPIGATLSIEGPYGLAHLRADSPRDIVCIAGGSGLAPVLSIARGASHSGMLDTRQLHFFYGGRTPSDICGEDMLRALPHYASAIRYRPVVSCPSPQDSPAWQGATGFVHEAVNRDLDAPLASFEFYFAGPPPMSLALQQMLMLEHQVPYEQIHFDRFF